MSNNTKKNLHHQVFEKLREKILKGELSPGTKLKEVQLAKTLNTSRTPIREALRSLEKEGLVCINPSQGAQVIKLSIRKIKNTFECRAVLEGLAIRQAIENVTNEDLELIEEAMYLAQKYYKNGQIKKTIEKNTAFHDQIIQCSQNPFLIQMMNTIRTQIVLYRTLTGFTGFRETFSDDHQEILKALSSKNADLAENLMRQHILADLETTLEVIEKKGIFTEEDEPLKIT